MHPAHVAPSNNPGRYRRVDGDCHPVDAVRRGLAEELGIEVDDGDVRLLGVLIESASIAVNFVALVTAEYSITEIYDAWSSASDRAEAVLLPPEMSPEFAPSLVTVSKLAALVPEGWAGFAGVLHASSKLRTILASLSVFGIAATMAACGNDTGVMQVVNELAGRTHISETVVDSRKDE